MDNQNHHDNHDNHDNMSEMTEMMEDTFHMDDENQQEQQQQQQLSYVNDQLIKQTNHHIQELYSKYENDEFMTSKIYHYVSQQLPALLQNTFETKQKCDAKKQRNYYEQDKFMNMFLNQGNYMYHPQTETYYQYNGDTYEEKEEAAIIHRIVTSITRTENPELLSWKHRTKVSILKQIKDHHLLKGIPDSNTIQRILSSFYPVIFRNKLHAKYFLTILGDNILKKEPSLVHFIHHSATSLLKQINQACTLKLNLNCTQTFKLKCHEKHYELENKLCRMVPIDKCVQTETTWREFLTKYPIELFGVASYYSQRYGNSDTFLLQHCNDHDMVMHVFKIKHNPLPVLFSQFCTEYLTITPLDEPVQNTDKEATQVGPAHPFSWECSPQDSYLSKVIEIEQKGDNTSSSLKTQISISWRNLLYLWRDFLQVHQYPLNLYLVQFRNYVLQHFPDRCIVDTQEDDITIIGIGSSHLPVIHKFLRFWTDTMIEDERDDCVLEIEEICSLFRKWLEARQPPYATYTGKGPYKKEKFLLNEGKILDILHYYQPNLEIEEQKFVYRYKNRLWDKELDVQQAMELIQQARQYNNINGLRTIKQAYSFYCNNYKKLPGKKEFVVSKLFFENYVKNNYADLFIR